MATAAIGRLSSAPEALCAPQKNSPALGAGEFSYSEQRWDYGAVSPHPSSSGCRPVDIMRTWVILAHTVAWTSRSIS